MLGADPEKLRRVRSDLDKYDLSLDGVFHAEALSLRRLYVLTTGNTEELSVTPITGPEKFGVLSNQTYRKYLLKSLQAHVTHFRVAAALAKSVPLSRVVRPSYPFLLDKLVDMLEHDFGR